MASGDPGPEVSDQDHEDVRSALTHFGRRTAATSGEVESLRRKLFTSPVAAARPTGGWLFPVGALAAAGVAAALFVARPSAPSTEWRASPAGATSEPSLETSAPLPGAAVLKRQGLDEASVQAAISDVVAAGRACTVVELEISTRSDGTVDAARALSPAPSGADACLMRHLGGLRFSPEAPGPGRARFMLD